VAPRGIIGMEVKAANKLVNLILKGIKSEGEGFKGTETL
jgi:hypothetical protein